MEANNKSKYIQGISLLLLIVAAGIFVVRNYQTSQIPEKQIQPKMSYAPAGQLIADFPAELVLDNKAAVVTSYSIDSAGANQKTAIFNSEKSIHDLFILSRGYFVKAGWKLTNVETDPGGDFVIFHAQKGTDELNISIKKQDNKSQLTISYLIRNK